jgi:small subunit ribosomal protein S20
MRQQEKRRLHNRTQRSRIKSAIKDVLNAPNAESGTTAFRHASALLDRMASRNLIHRNKASRKKSQLARHIARLD